MTTWSFIHEQPHVARVVHGIDPDITKSETSDQETFPSGVDDVSKSSDGTWWCSGTEARWLGRATSRVVKNVPVSTPDQRVPVILAEIHVEGMSPQRWVEQRSSTDGRTTDGRLAPVDVNVLCASWMALRVDDQASGEP